MTVGTVVVVVVEGVVSVVVEGVDGVVSVVVVVGVDGVVSVVVVEVDGVVPAVVVRVDGVVPVELVDDVVTLSRFLNKLSNKEVTLGWLCVLVVFATVELVSFVAPPLETSASSEG